MTHSRPPKRPSSLPPKPASRPRKPIVPDSLPQWTQEESQGPEKLQKICGLQAVGALFRRHPERVVRLYYGEDMKKSAGPFCSELAKRHNPYRLLDEEELVKVSGTPLHGGIVAAATPREVAPAGFQQLSQWSQTRKPLIILDGIGNPNNLGAIARTMAFFGLEHLLLSDHPEQSGLSDSAYRVAEGGLEYLQIAHLPNLPETLRSLRQYYRVIGTAVAKTATPLEDLKPDHRRPIALVLGNEQTGLSKPVMASCEAVVTIQGRGQIQSLNVAATAAILIHQLASQTPKRGGAEPRKIHNKTSTRPKNGTVKKSLRPNRPHGS